MSGSETRAGITREGAFSSFEGLGGPCVAFNSGSHHFSLYFPCCPALSRSCPLCQGRICSQSGRKANTILYVVRYIEIQRSLHTIMPLTGQIPVACQWRCFRMFQSARWRRNHSTALKVVACHCAIFLPIPALWDLTAYFQGPYLEAPPLF